MGVISDFWVLVALKSCFFGFVIYFEFFHYEDIFKMKLKQLNFLKLRRAHLPSEIGLNSHAIARTNTVKVEGMLNEYCFMW